MAVTEVWQSESAVVIPLVFTIRGIPIADLTGATLTAVLKRTDINPATEGTSTGAYLITGAAPTPNFTYQPSAADTGTPGDYEVQVKAAFTSPTRNAFSDPFHLRVKATF